MNDQVIAQLRRVCELKATIVVTCARLCVVNAVQAASADNIRARAAAVGPVLERLHADIREEA